MNNYSIIIPIHNEIDYIPNLLNSLKYYKERGHEILVIDDGSDDGSREALKENNIIKLISLSKNNGKGYAIKIGLKKARYNKILIYDGDMEINPLDISKLMILDEGNGIKYVMGYRFKSFNLFKSNFDLGNIIFTTFFNLLFSTNYKDILCCAKSFYKNDLCNYNIKSNGFDIDVELTSILSFRCKKRFFSQVKVRYQRRSIEGGKKLKINDGWIILFRIIRTLQYI